MSKFSFNEETCIGCGVCVRICPKGLIRMDTDGPKMDEASAKRCNNCGQCVAFCPAKSAMQEFSRGVELEDALAYSSERGPTILKFLKSRRSERIYQPDPVPHETLMDFTPEEIDPLADVESFKLALTRLWNETKVHVDWSRPVDYVKAHPSY